MSRVRDTRMMARALEERWPLDPTYRSAIIKKLMSIVLSKDASRREIIAASRALIAADAVNLAEEIEPRDPTGINVGLTVNVSTAAEVVQRIDMTKLSDEQLMQLVANGGMLPGGSGVDNEPAGAIAGGQNSPSGEGGESARREEPAQVRADGLVDRGAGD